MIGSSPIGKHVLIIGKNKEGWITHVAKQRAYKSEDCNDTFVQVLLVSVFNRSKWYPLHEVAFIDEPGDLT